MESSSTYFTCFTELPLELQRKIWVHAFSPRVLVLGTEIVVSDSIGYLENYACFLPSTNHCEIPDVAQSCREAYMMYKESRQAVFKASHTGTFYPRTLPAAKFHTGPPRIFLSPEDTLYFQTPSRFAERHLRLLAIPASSNTQNPPLLFGTDLNISLRFKFAFPLKYFISPILFSCVRAFLYHHRRTEIMVVDFTAKDTMGASGPYHLSNLIEEHLSLIELPEEDRGRDEFMGMLENAAQYAETSHSRREDIAKHTFGHDSKMISVAEFRNLKIRRMALYSDSERVQVQRN